MNIGISEAFKIGTSVIALSNDDVRPLNKCWDIIMIERLEKDNLAYISPILVNEQGKVTGPIVVLPGYLKVLLFMTFYDVIPSWTFPLIRWINKFTMRAIKSPRSSLSNSFFGIVNTQLFLF